MSHRLLLSLLTLVAYCTVTWAQFNPSNPSEPSPQRSLTLEANPTGGGTFNLNTVTMQLVDEVISLRAYPGSDFTFINWTEGDSVVSTSASFSYKMPYRDVKLTAHFKYTPGNPTEPDKPILYHRLFLKASPTDGGDINVGSGNKYLEGASVDLRASNRSNFTFVNWTEGDSVVSETASFRYTMPDYDATLVANFRYTPGNPDEPKEPHLQHNVFLVSNPATAGYFNVASGNRYTEGTSQTFIAYGNTGFSFAYWTIGDSIVSTNSSYPLMIPDHDITLQAHFNKYSPNNPAEPDPADGHAAFYGMTETVLCGETAMYPVYLEKTALSQNGFTMVAKGYMLDIAFPKGFKVNKDSVMLHHINDQTYSIEELNDTTFRITVLGEDVLASDNGMAMEIPVKIPDNAVKGMTYPVNLIYGVLMHPDDSKTAVSVRNGGLYINGIVPPTIFMRKGFVHITSEQQGTVIHYTTDDTEPTLASPTYVQPLFFKEGTLVKAVAVYASYISDVTEYVVPNNVAEKPEISFEDPLLTMICKTEDAVIHYTLDGSVPTEKSEAYSAPIEIGAPCLVKALAVGNELMADSGIEEFEIQQCDSVVFEFSERQLAISCSTEDAVIHYTIDGTTPDASSSVYEGPIDIVYSCTVKAVAFKKGILRSEVGEYKVIGSKLKVPTFTYKEPLLTISCETEGATIHYAINGEEAEYTEPIEITEPCTVYAYATKPYFSNSDTLSYNVIRCAEPVISYTGGNVRISCETEGARIYYTIDGTIPDSTALRYTEPFTVSHNMTVKAVAYLDGALHSNITDYIIDVFKVSTPTFAYNEPLLAISCETEGATIHYIINGEESEYTEPVEITKPCTVYAYATKPYFNNSDTISYTVEIKNMEFSSNGLSYNILSFDDYTCEVIKSHDAEYQGNIVIPYTVEYNNKSWNVVAIADEAFKDCHKVTSIIIPNSITAVGKGSLETGNRNMLLYCTSQTLPLMPKDFGNIIIDGVANFIRLVDSPSDGTLPTHDFSCPEPFTARKISYEHSYTQHTGIGFSEGWETIALPFDVQTVYHVTAQEAIAPFKAGDTQKKFWLRELTDAGFVEAEAIKAYTPYIISMPNNEEYMPQYNMPGKVSFRAVNALVAPEKSSAVSQGDKMFTPAMHGVDAADNVYAINSYHATDNYREGSCFIANLRNVRPFEAYIMSEQPLPARAFTLSELNGNEDTGIENVAAPSTDIPACYNLAGQKVGTGYKGIVIRNGKKTLVK